MLYLRISNKNLVCHYVHLYFALVKFDKWFAEKLKSFLSLNITYDFPHAVNIILIRSKLVTVDMMGYVMML